MLSLLKYVQKATMIAPSKTEQNTVNN